MKFTKTYFHQFFFPKVNEDGWKFISFLAFFSVICSLIWLPLGIFSFIITVFCFYSFRDPQRITPVLSSLVLSPIDGYVIAINKEKGPEILGMQNKKFNRITIFCSIFDVNTVRMPIKAKITKLFYDCGKFLSKSFDKNNITNEKIFFALKNSDGMDFILQETTVFCAKRIACFVKKADELNAGQRIGFIRFGGYIDVFLPEKINPLVCIGQKMVGGETVIADIKSDAPRIEGEIR